MELWNTIVTSSYLVAGVRTPIGAFRGGLSTVKAPQLGAVAIRAALEHAGVSGTDVDEVIMGNVLQAGVGQAPARQAALGAGLPTTIAAVTVNKVCGSGLKAVMMADQAIRCGDADVIVAGGMENMTLAPHLSFGIREGIRLGDYTVKDAMVHDGLTCAFESCHMGNHAEHIARKYDVSREDQDRFSLQSQQRAAAAMKANAFANEMVPVTVPGRKGDTVVQQDECPRESTLESLAGLRPVFQKDGSVTAGNASTISDGAAAVVVVSQEKAQALAEGLKFPGMTARIVGSHTAGVDPQDLFIAPALAIRDLLDRQGLGLDDIDVFEINEAFASQMVACCKELKLDQAKVNPLGGGISLGHPIGASGSRVLVTLMHEMARQDFKRGIASLCLGGGNAVAMLIERP